MKRWTWGLHSHSPNVDVSLSAIEDSKGEWVSHPEAKAEIEKARQDSDTKGYDRGFLAGWDCYAKSMRPEPKPYDDHWKHVHDPMEKLKPTRTFISSNIGSESYSLFDLADKINALVDAVNDLRSRQYTQSDIDKLSRGER